MGQPPRIVEVRQRSDLETEILQACVLFALASKASPGDNFFSIPPKYKNSLRRLNLTSKQLATAIKTSASTLGLNPDHYSTSSFKRAGISLMIMAGVDQSVVNAASGHSQKGNSNVKYQALHELPSGASEYEKAKFGEYESNLNTASYMGGGTPANSKEER